VLLMLALLFWQLLEEFEQRQNAQRQLGHAYSQQLADNLSLSMQLKAHAGLALLRQSVGQPPSAELLPGLREIFPTLQSLAWLDAQGRIHSDSQHGLDDATYLGSLFERIRGQTYHFAFSQDSGQVYLLLRQAQEAKPGGYWAL